MSDNLKSSVLIGEEMAYTLGAFIKLSPEAQKKIMDAAAHIFAQEGYHYASISNICRQAGISNGALYKYFKNKEALFLAVVDYSVKLVETELYQKYMVNSGSVLQAVRNLLMGMMQFIALHQDYIAIYCDLGSSSMNRFAAIASEKYRQVSSIFTIKMVAESKARQEISDRIQNEVAACLIDSYITLFSFSLVSEYHNNRFNAFFTGNGGPPSHEQQIELIIQSLRQVLQD